MDPVTLMNSMKTISENLVLVPQNSCSDEFLAALEELSVKATDISKRIKEKKCNRQQRLLTTASSSSESVTCITEVVETVDVDSDSDDSGNMNNVSIGSSKIQSPTASKSNIQSLSYKRNVQPEVILKRVDKLRSSSPLRKRRCTVKLHRINAAQLLGTHGLDQNNVAVSGDIAEALSQHSTEVATKKKRPRRNTQYPLKLQLPNENNSK